MWNHARAGKITNTLNRSTINRSRNSKEFVFGFPGVVIKFTQIHLATEHITFPFTFPSCLWIKDLIRVKSINSAKTANPPFGMKFTITTILSHDSKTFRSLASLNIVDTITPMRIHSIHSVLLPSSYYPSHRKNNSYHNHYDNLCQKVSPKYQLMQ